MPSVPWVSLLSQASTYPPRFWPKVMASSRAATVLPAPPLGLTTVIWRSPPKLRRTASVSRRSSSSRLPGLGLTAPKLARRTAPRRPTVAARLSGCDTATRRRANSSAVGAGA